jgi:hypothetical protein
MAACGGNPGQGQTTGSGAAGGSTTSNTGASAGGGAGGSGAAGGSGGTGGVQAPTISTWLGTNMSADLPRVDITYQLSPFDTPAAQKDENGYPAAGASGKSSTDIGFVLPTGAYKISYKGTGKLAVSGIGKLDGAFTEVNGEQRGTLQITGTPGSFGQFLTLTVTNGPGQTVTDLHILMPGFDYVAPDLFLPQLVGLLAPFRALRFMDWEATNGSKLADWADRPAASHFGHSDFGEPYEHIAELVNVTGKDMWITVPEHATDDFIHSFAQFLGKQLDFGRIQKARDQQGFSTPFRLFVENSNETWNQGFSAYKTFLDAANMDPARYTGKYTGKYGPSWMSGITDLMKVGQYEGDRLVKIAKIFRDELGAAGKGDIVAPVLSGWALGPAYSDVALLFIKDNYGDPKTFVDRIAIAPYFGPDDKQTGALDSLFADTGKAIDSMDATFQDFAKLSADYGIPMAAYEGGQSLSGAENQPIKHLAQHDQRMYDAYVKYFALWKKDFGESLFMHFSLAGIPGLPENIYQYGYWGSIIGVLEDPAKCSPGLPTLMGNEMIADVVHHCPKYRALREQAPP